MKKVITIIFLLYMVAMMAGAVALFRAFLRWVGIPAVNVFAAVLVVGLAMFWGACDDYEKHIH